MNETVGDWDWIVRSIKDLLIRVSDIEAELHPPKHIWWVTDEGGKRHGPYDSEYEATMTACDIGVAHIEKVLADE